MSRFSVKKPLTVFVAVVIIIALGIVSVTGMTPDLLPSIDLPYVVVMTTYPGATPEEVESEVTKPLEQSLATVESLKSIQSISNSNYSLVVLEFDNGSSMDTAVVNILQQVDLVEGGWSDSIGAPYIMKINPPHLFELHYNLLSKFIIAAQFGFVKPQFKIFSTCLPNKFSKFP